MPNFTGKSGGGPHHMKKYGQGKNQINTSPIDMYGGKKGSMAPMLGDLDKDGKMSGYETARQTAIEKNTKGGPKMKYGSPMDKYGKKGSMATKKKKLKDMPDAQRKAVFASGYKG